MEQTFSTGDIVTISYDTESIEPINRVLISLDRTIPGHTQDITNLIKQSPRARDYIEKLIREHARQVIEDNNQYLIDEYKYFKNHYSFTK